MDSVLTLTSGDATIPRNADISIEGEPIMGGVGTSSEATKPSLGSPEMLVEASCDGVATCARDFACTLGSAAASQQPEG